MLFNTYDAYSGYIMVHHLDDMPVRVSQEVIDFGTFVDFYLFCAGRWGDDGMLQEHYALKSVKALRSATAHSHCILNGFTRAEARDGHSTPRVIIDSLNDVGISRTKNRRAKLSYLRRVHAVRLADFRDAYQGHMVRYRLNSSFVSFFDFMFRLVDIWLPCEA